MAPSVRSKLCVGPRIMEMRRPVFDPSVKDESHVTRHQCRESRKSTTRIRKFGDLIITKFMTHFMMHAKSLCAEPIVYGCGLIS